MTETRYANDPNNSGFYKVKFMVNETGVLLTRGFDSPYFAEKFVNKLKHSKKCTLVSYPIF